MYFSYNWMLNSPKVGFWQKSNSLASVSLFWEGKSIYPERKKKDQDASLLIGACLLSLRKKEESELVSFDLGNESFELFLYDTVIDFTPKSYA